MKKLMKQLLLVSLIALMFALCACAVGITCISHIDRDQDGKCDNCGNAVAIDTSTVKSISIKTKPTKEYYGYGETLDLTGGVINVVYKDGSPDEELSLSAEGVEVTAPPMSSKGMALVAVSYGGKRTTFTIEVGPQKYNVSFNLGYTTQNEIPVQKVEVTQKAVRPEDPQRDGYTFRNWYSDAELTEIFDFEIVTIIADTVIYAGWTEKVNVTFDLNYDDSVDDVRQITKGQSVSEPEEPTRAGYVFDGWYKQDSDTEYNFYAQVEAAFTLYAKWIRVCTVTYDLNYVSAPTAAVDNVLEGENARTPVAPERAGYVFAGWYLQGACTAEYDFDTPLGADLTIYAKWIAIHTVTFNMQGATSQAISEQKINDGNSATQPTAPEKTGYSFGGWYNEEACTNAFNFNSAINADTELFAKWIAIHTVTYNLNYTNAPAADTEEVLHGESADSKLVSRTGFVFMGWYNEVGCTTAYDFDSAVNQDVTIYAKWEAEAAVMYTVTYNYNYVGAPTAPTARVNEGAKAAVPSAPSREGYSFVGWYTTSACTTAYNFDASVNADLVIFARWVALPRVVYNLNYTNAPAAQEVYVQSGASVTAPTAPERDGFVFGGWYTTSACTTAYNFSSSVTSNVVLYAKWSEVFTVSFNLGYASAPAITAQNIQDGNRASRPADPSRGGYTFGGWFTDSSTTSAFSFTTAITGDLVLYAKWTSTSATEFNVTFNLNYTGAPTPSVQVIDRNSVAVMPANPTRAAVTTKGHQALNFSFGGWYTDSKCTTAFDFTTPITEDTQLFAKWTGTYIFEAEHVSFIDFRTGYPIQGMGASGGSEGPNMIDSPSPTMVGLNPSNGYYVTYLYAEGITLRFVINSDRAVSDVTMVFRISAENSPFAINPLTSEGTTWEHGTRLSKYDIILNGEAIMYDTIEVIDVQGHTESGGKRPFSDFDITQTENGVTVKITLSLLEGENEFLFITANSNGMGGTMSGTAPVIDCIKLTTSAELSWEPEIDNEIGQ